MTLVCFIVEQDQAILRGGMAVGLLVTTRHRYDEGPPGLRPPARRGSRHQEVLRWTQG